MSDEQTTIAQAIQDVTDKAQLLVREEIELAKAEVQQKVSKLAKGAAIGVAAGVFVIGALSLLLQGFAWLAWRLLSEDSGNIFWGFFLVAAVLILLAALAGFLAARAFKAGAPPAPQMAIEEAKLIRETVTASDPERTV